MIIVGKLPAIAAAALLSAFVLPSFGESALAQGSAEAARSRCFAQVQKQWPRTDGESMKQREMAYRACAQKAGVRP